jgi:hypothetical protein
MCNEQTSAHSIDSLLYSRAPVFTDSVPAVTAARKKKKEN